jgi:multimeric flavodoxin WrbA
MTKKKAVKKVLVLLGSPRKKGNSALLAERIAKGAKSVGAKVETLFMHVRYLTAKDVQSMTTCSLSIRS